MTRIETSKIFIDALSRQVKRKSQLRDGIEAGINPWVAIASIAEELGEASSDYQRQRIAGCIQECVDIAHSALLLAIELDPEGYVLSRIGFDNNPERQK